MSRKTSQKRIDANRRNALKSTGPRTPEGKAASSQNAITHGLTRNPLPSGCFLKMEDQGAFMILLNEYVATYNPQHRDELDLVTEAAYAKWRQQRLWVAESNQLEIAIALNEVDLQRALPLANSNAHLANGIAKSEQILKLYLRYHAQLNRHYRNALKDLRELQDRRQVEPPSAPETPQPEAPEPETQNEPKPPAVATEAETQSEANPTVSTPEDALALARRAQIQRLMDLNLGRIQP